MMERYKIKTASGYFGIGYDTETGEVIIRQARGKAPTINEVKAGLAALPTIAPSIRMDYPWRIAVRNGMSGCTDYSILERFDDAFGFERRVAHLHMSMEGKLNEGYHGPLALLHWALEGVDPSENVEIILLPNTETRVWRDPGDIDIKGLKMGLDVTRNDKVVHAVNLIWHYCTFAIENQDIIISPDIKSASFVDRETGEETGTAKKEGDRWSVYPGSHAIPERKEGDVKVRLEGNIVVFME